MLFLVLLASAIAKDYVVGVSSSPNVGGNLVISTKDIDLKSNIRTYTVKCSLDVVSNENNTQFLHIFENGIQLDAKVTNVSTISYKANINQNGTTCSEKRYTCEYLGAKIDEQVVTLGEPPSMIDPAHFKCFSENLNYLHCHFPANTDHCQFGTSYSLLLMNSDTFESCKLVKVNDSFSFDSRDQSCQYPVDEEMIEFRLRISNQFGSVTQRILVNHYDVVRPAAPYSIVVENQQKQIIMSWKSKKNLNYFGRKFEYSFLCKNDSRVETNHMIFRRTLGKTFCPQPKVRLRVIPESTNQETIWSDWGFRDRTPGKARFNCLSCSKKPDENRLVGVFNYIENSDQSMTIEVFWQRDSTSNETNVMAVSETGITYQPSLNSLQPTFGRAEFHNMNHEAFRITLQRSIPGKSPHLEGFQVQPIMASHQPRFKKLLNNNKSFEVSWYPPENQNDLQGYTVMYCHLTASTVCEESVVFQKLPPTDTFFNIYSEKTLNFAVSAEYPTYTSSLVWQQCIVSPSTNTHNKSPKFHFFDVSSNSLKLRLEPSCEDRSLYELLQVHVIDSTSGHPVTSRTYPPHETVVEIVDLAPDTSYEVLLVAYNSSNVPHEARRRVVTAKTGSDDRPIVYIATGVVLLIAMISSAYRVTVRIRAIMDIEVEFPFGLLRIDEEPVRVCVERKCLPSDGVGGNYVVKEQKQAYLEAVQEEEMGDDLGCGQCGVTPLSLGEFAENSWQPNTGYLSVDVIMKRGI
ncbi:cytokine receptor [Culex quinquefasciatus]|uniref:cytokine receptor n=1 Tax=Culex quinquefasciatus TaxID=7176 RepID=UPI0018E3D89B|nr:cytokine receptor [Culex quinquefasciatus]